MVSQKIVRMRTILPDNVPISIYDRALLVGSLSELYDLIVEDLTDVIESTLNEIFLIIYS